MSIFSLKMNNHHLFFNSPQQTDCSKCIFSNYKKVSHLSPPISRIQSKTPWPARFAPVVHRCYLPIQVTYPSPGRITQHYQVQSEPEIYRTIPITLHTDTMGPGLALLTGSVWAGRSSMSGGVMLCTMRLGPGSDLKWQERELKFTRWPSHLWSHTLTVEQEPHE